MYRRSPRRLRSVGCHRRRCGETRAPALYRRGLRKLLSRVNFGLQEGQGARRRGARDARNLPLLSMIWRALAALGRPRWTRCEKVRERPILTTLFAINTVIASNMGFRESVPARPPKGRNALI